MAGADDILEYHPLRLDLFDNLLDVLVLQLERGIVLEWIEPPPEEEFGWRRAGPTRDVSVQEELDSREVARPELFRRAVPFKDDFHEDHLCEFHLRLCQPVLPRVVGRDGVVCESTSRRKVLHDRVDELAPDYHSACFLGDRIQQALRRDGTRHAPLFYCEAPSAPCIA